MILFTDVIREVDHDGEISGEGAGGTTDCAARLGGFAGPVRGGSGAWRALSRCRTKNATRLRLVYFQAAATASRHVFIAAARKVRCVWADTRWRWTLKML